MKSKHAESPARRVLRVAGSLAFILALVGLAIWMLRDSPPSSTTMNSRLADVTAPPPSSIPGVATFSAKTSKADDLPPAVQRYLESTVYPPGTGRLDAAQGDLIHPNQRYEDFRRILDTYNEDESQVVSVRLTADHFFYTGDEIIELRLQVRRGSIAIWPISVEAHANREGRGGSKGAAIPIRFHRDGEDLVANLDSARFADHHGPILVETRIEYDAGAFYDEPLRFFYTPSNKIPARFTGRFRDALTHGSLQLDIEVDVDIAGFYRLDANLYDRFGNPISFSAFKGNLASGKRFVPVRFFGRVLRDANANGPYRVGQIRGYRFLESEYPDRERIPDFVGHYQTARYDVDQFSDEEFTSEHKEGMVRLLLEDVARGISIDQPPVATVGAQSASSAEPN